jgi:Uncharacterized protein conserved in bacteria containing a pentein-type domain
MPEAQSVADVLMIRPVRFMGNPQTSASNVFQQLGALSQEEAQRLARAEFDALVTALSEAGVRVHVVDDTPEPHTPDSIFPNNWVSFHADGTVVLYPMMAENRRLERRLDILDALQAKGFSIRRIVDLSSSEQHGKFLEGTGSLVLDRINSVAYACLSPRTDTDVLARFANELGYELEVFEAIDAAGVPIYHTNVLMWIGERVAAVCAESIRGDARTRVCRRLRDSGREVVELDAQQMHAFAGNMLELRTERGERVLAMSTTAHDALNGISASG